MKALPILLIIAPVAALAASPFDGTWVTRAGSFRESAKPYVLIVDQNEFRCDDCGAPLRVKPDGQVHEVSGHGYDHAAVKIINPRSVVLVLRKGEKILDQDTFVASQDGKQLRVRILDQTGENGMHYEAKFNAAPVAIEGDPTHVMVSVRKLSGNEVQETDTLNGQPTDETVYAVSPDGKSIKVTDKDTQSGHDAHWVLDRQK